MNPRIVLVPPSPAVAEIAREMAPGGFELVLTRSDAHEFTAALDAAEYMVCYPNVKMPDAFYRAAPRLKLVQLLSAGYDNVDLEAARRAKVPVSNNGGANAISVAEHALMLMLTVADEALILSNRIVVMSARPGRVKAVLENTLPNPRHVTVQLSPEYAKLKAEIWSLVESEVRRHDAASRQSIRAGATL